MKTLAIRGYCILSVIILFLGAALPARAQYSGSNLETGGLYTALAKDANNNSYVTRVTPETSGATYEVEEYTNGTGTPTIIYTGLTHEINDFPWGLAVTSTGDVYVTTDFTTGGGSIIKLTKSGSSYTPSTFQTGRYFSALAIDKNNNLYTAEYDASNKTYAVVEYAAGSSAGSAGTNLYDHLTSAAGYAYPTGLAIAANGDVYVADAFSNTPSITDGGHVYKLTAAASYAVSTISSGNYASALALDATGNLYSTENRGSGYSLIEYANSSGTGVPVFNALHTNGIYYPWGIAVYSAAKVFVADGDDGVNGGAVIQLSPTPPTVTTSAVTALSKSGATLNGTVNDNDHTTTVNFIYGNSPTLTGATTKPATTGGTINAGSGNTPVALSITGLSASTTYYYAVSATNSGGTVQGAILNFITPPSLGYTSPESYLSGVTISPLSPTHSTVPALAYAPPVAIGSGFGGPFGVATDASGNVYVADYSNNTIDEMPPDGGTPVALATGLSSPAGVAVDAAGNVYFSETTAGDVKKIPSGGGTPTLVGSGFSEPYGVAVDATGNVYVAAYGSSNVMKIPFGGGTPVAVGSGLVNPVGVAVDAYGNVFVADYGNSTVMEVRAAGGSPVAIGSGYKNPTGVAVDGAGNVYVADYLNNAVEIVAPGGSPMAIGSGFSAPSSVAVDPNGNVYVADYDNASIKQLTPVGGFHISAALPLGLSFDGSSGTISGTPAQISPATNYTVTAYDPGGGTSAVVNIKISANANLAGLALSAGVLSPAFAAGTINYTASVANSVASVTVTPTNSDPSATGVTVNGVAVTSGTASGPIALNVGSNTITTIVTAQDGVTKKTYTVTVIRESGNDNLSALTLSSGSLSPAFASGTKTYTATVANNVASVTVTPTTSDPSATGVTVNGIAVTSGSASGPVVLNAGLNTITVIVTAHDPSFTKTYTVTVTRESGNDNLSALTLSSGTLSPVFSGTVKTYTASVGYGVSTLTVTPTTSDPSATGVTVNGITVKSGTASGAVALSAGQNTITVIVTAHDPSFTKTYTVTVTRAPSTNAVLSGLSISAGTLNPAFATETTSYSASVGNGVTSLMVTPTTSNSGATVTVNGMAVTSGSASGPVTLNVGSNAITTIVTAQDGVTTKTYTITVTRAPSANAILAKLIISAGTLSPAFATETTSYTASVGNGVTSVTVTPTTSNSGATVTVNGMAVTSGSASGPVTLNVGSNAITTIVTAQDGVTTKTYTITVTRAPSANAILAKLIISAGTLSPAFATETTSYSVSVGNGVTSVTVTPTTSNSGATVTVNGMAVTSGSASGPVALNVGSNAITTIVTAQDGVTTKTYTITVTRAPSANAILAKLHISMGTLSPAFATETTSYTASVGNGVTSVTVTPTTSNSGATVTVNGMEVTSGSASGPVALNVGSNAITTIVTAQDGVTKKTYTITVTRESGSDNTVYQPVSVETPADSPQLADDGIIVHRGVSPNGDGIDDFLQIDNIISYPDNRLMIMNRNGILVYEVKGYDNISRIFDGHSNKTGQMQLPGTYFYSLDYTVKGIAKHKTGFLVLKY